MPKRSYVRLNIPESTLPPAIETSLPTTAEGLTIDGIGVSFTETGTTTLKANYNHNTVVTYNESVISLEGGQSSPLSGTVPSGTSLPGMPFDTVIGPLVIKSVGAGETQIVFQPDNTDAFSSVTINVKVTSLDDSSFLNKRGLEYFWDKIDDKKQNKLTAGSNITISGNTISATQPTVNNATLTIQKNGTNVATFTANSSSNVTANVSVPTKTSDLTNDSGFIGEVSTITNARIDEIMGVA